MVKFEKNEIKKLVESNFHLPQFKITDMTGSKRGSNGFPVVIEEVSSSTKFFLKIVKKEEFNQEDIDFEISTLKELAKLKNPNLVKLLGVIDGGNGFIILKFEYIKGETLEDIIQKKNNGGKFSDEDIYKLGIEVFNAIKSIDSIGKVHQDIKPSNIIFDGNKYILSDLGIARFKEPIVSKRSKISYKYTSPEQLYSYMNISPRPTVSIQSDLFCLGIILYEMATLKYPFGNGDFEKIVNSAVQEAPISINTSISIDLSNIIMRLLRRRVSERFLNINDLEKCLNNKTFTSKITKFYNAVYYLQNHPSSTRFSSFLEYKNESPKLAPAGIVLSSSFFPKDDRMAILAAQEYKFLVDPETYLLPFKSKSQKNQLKNVKYNLKTNDYFDKLIKEKKIDDWLEDAINYQLDKGGDYILTPTFLISNPNDKNINLNLHIIQKTINFAKNKGLMEPVIAHYIVKRDYISDDQSRDFLISQIIAIDDLCAILLTTESDVSLGREPKCNSDLLSAIKDFTEKVSQKFPVILNYSGVESIPLFAYGLSGTVTNMYKTNFRTDRLNDIVESNNGGGGRSKSFFYVPGLMNFLEVREISAILKALDLLKKNNKVSTLEVEKFIKAFSCDCPFCKNANAIDDKREINDILESIENWKESDLDNHYIFNVVFEGKKIMAMDSGESKKYIKEKIELAKSFYSFLLKKTAIKLKKASAGSFLVGWENIFLN